MKALLHLDAIKTNMPVHLTVSLTSRCNHDCLRCNVKGLLTDRNTDINTEKCCDILEQFTELGLKAIHFSGNGNATLHPDIVSISIFALSLGLEVGILTNGKIDNPFGKLIKDRFAFCRFSIDAGTNKTYQFLRNTEDTLSDLRKDVEKVVGGNCYVSSNFILQPENLDEMEEFVEFSIKAGMASCRFNIDRTPSQSQFLLDNFLIISKQIRLLQQKYRSNNFKVNFRSDRFKLLNQKKKSFNKCYYNISPIITEKCELYACCMLDNNPAGYLGSLLDSDLNELWRNKKEVDISKCPMCYHDEENILINKLFELKHINFA